MELFETGNYAGLLGYVSDEERELLSLDEESFAELVNRIYKPNTAGFEPSSNLRIDRPSEFNAVAVREYKHPDGRAFQLIIPVTTGDRRAHVASLVYFVVGAALTAKLRRSALHDDGPTHYQALLQAFEEELPVLSSLRIPGYCLVEDGRYTFHSWEKIHDHFSERARLEPAPGAR